MAKRRATVPAKILGLELLRNLKTLVVVENNDHCLVLPRVLTRTQSGNTTTPSDLK